MTVLSPRALSVLAVLCFLFLQGCGASALDFEKTQFEYVELVRESADCVPACSIEYVLQSNGLLFSRVDYVPVVASRQAGPESITIHVANISSTVAQDLIARFKQKLSVSQSASVNSVVASGKSEAYATPLDVASPVSVESSYHLFYGSSKEVRKQLFSGDTAPYWVSEFSTELSQLDARSSTTSYAPWFLHFVFTQQNGVSLDYHFWPDGTVLKEGFGSVRGDLLKAEVLQLSPEDISQVKAAVSDDFFSASDGVADCPVYPVSWGYLEVYAGSVAATNSRPKYHVVQTCGGGDTAADELFKLLLEWTGGAE